MIDLIVGIHKECWTYASKKAALIADRPYLLQWIQMDVPHSVERIITNFYEFFE